MSRESRAPRRLEFEFDVPAEQRSKRGVALGTNRTIALNGNVTGNVDLYDEDGTFEAECQGCGGWGSAAFPGRHELATGLYGGLITIWSVGRSELIPIATLQLSGDDIGSEPLGIAFDARGDVFAGNYPANTIDEFTAATIVAGGGRPDRSFEVGAFSQVYYLAAAGDLLFVDGWDKSFNFIVGDVNLKGDGMRTTILQTLGSLSAGTGFPGGLAVDAHKNLIVDNQYAGTLATYAQPWTGKANSKLDWGYIPNDYTGITLDAASQTLWAANIYTEGSVTTSFGVPNSYPLGSIGRNTTPPVNDRYVGASFFLFDR
jgi:hypothetical protein